MSAAKLKSRQEREAAEALLEHMKNVPRDRLRGFLQELNTHLADDSPAWSGFDRKKKISTAMAALNMRTKELASAAIPLKEQISRYEREKAAWQDIQELLTSPLTFSKPASSRFHDAMASTPISGENQNFDERFGDLIKREVKVFLVEHNWHGAFQNAGEFAEGEARLPYPLCCFEFQISGKRLCALFFDLSESQPVFVPLCQTSVGWIFAGEYEYDGAKWVSSIKNDFTLAFADIAERITKQVRAICIALDASVAETEIVRAPYRLNQAREKRGQLPILDYHLISLARRSRPAAFEHERLADGAKTRRRLHFRRGHWRHYETHKTWIKWMLVGDPELGFIDKHYRL